MSSLSLSRSISQDVWSIFAKSRAFAESSRPQQFTFTTRWGTTTTRVLLHWPTGYSRSSSSSAVVVSARSSDLIHLYFSYSRKSSLCNIYTFPSIALSSSPSLLTGFDTNPTGDCFCCCCCSCWSWLACWWTHREKYVFSLPANVSISTKNVKLSSSIDSLVWSLDIVCIVPETCRRTFYDHRRCHNI